MKKNITVFLLLFVYQANSQSWSEKMAQTVMMIWKDSMSSSGRPAKWGYEQGVVLKGIEGLWYNTGEKKYFDYLQKSMDLFVGEEGNIKTYEYASYNIDNILPGRNLLTLFKVTGSEKYYKAAASLRNQLRTHPRTKAGGFWHKKIYPWQMWLDGLYMGQPFSAEWAKNFGEDTAFDDIARQFIFMERFSRDSGTGLLYHGYDESREQKWAHKQTGLSPHIWSRAMGWYGMGLIDVLEYFPANHAKRDSLVQILHRFAAAVTKYQDKATGLWWNIMDLPAREKNYYESSASCMLVYTLAKSVRLGLLPNSYLKPAQKGYDGIITRFIKTENGQVNLHGTVSVSGLGGNPYRDGSFDYYMSEKVVVNDPKGVGAFLQASNEMEILPTVKLGKGKTVVLDHYFNHELKKDITGATMQHHYVWEQRDLNGYSLLGHVFNKYGIKSEGIGEPTPERLKQADFYLIVDPDTQKETELPNFIQPSHIGTIYNWVKNGGVLLLLGNDSGNAELTHFNQLAKRFGIQFNPDSRNKVAGNNYEMGILEIPVNHPIFKTAKKIYIKEFSSQQLTPPARAVLTNGNTVVMSVSRVGKGTVFALGDPWLYNEYTDGRKLPPDYENYQAANDLVSWLARLSKNK